MLRNPKVVEQNYGLLRSYLQVCMMTSIYSLQLVAGYLRIIFDDLHFNYKTDDIANIIFKYIKENWKLTISDDQESIINDGNTFYKTFRMRDKKPFCFARTDQEMISNSGIYKIQFKIEELTRSQLYNAIGICTDYYTNDIIYQTNNNQ